MLLDWAHATTAVKQARNHLGKFSLKTDSPENTQRAVGDPSALNKTYRQLLWTYFRF